MKVGDLVKIQDVSRSPTDVRQCGVILEDYPCPPSMQQDVKVQVMWQNGVIGLIHVRRLEIVSEDKELSDDQLEHVRGGMSQSTFSYWRAEFLNDSR